MDSISWLKSSLSISCGLIYMSSVLPISACAEKPDFNISVSAPPHVVFLGDSITSGYGLDAYDKDDKSKCASYANILTQVFESELPPEADFSSANFGKDGLTSGGLLKKLKNGEMDAALRDADAVVVSIGGNNLLGPVFDMLDEDIGLKETIDRVISLESKLDENLAKLDQDMPYIVDEIYDRTKNDDIILFFQMLYDPFEDFYVTPVADMAGEKIDILNDTIQKYSENGDRYIVIDIPSEFVGRAKELTNINKIDIHPNADGHSVIAKKIYEVVESYTYTYYDDEAAMQYEIELAQKKQLEEEENIKRKKMTAIGSGGAAVVALSAGGISVVRRRKRRKGV